MNKVRNKLWGWAFRQFMLAPFGSRREAFFNGLCDWLGNYMSYDD